jgi:hypothetical protein
MAGTALLPWEEWLARLLHPLYVAIRRTLHKRERRHDLHESEGWPQAEGAIHSKKWDSSLPREELLYSYSTAQGYYSGTHWLWFERSEPHEVKVCDRIILRYMPDDPQRSVFLRFG